MAGCSLTGACSRRHRQSASGRYCACGAASGEAPLSVAGHLTLFVTWLIVNDCVKRAALSSIGR